MQHLRRKLLVELYKLVDSSIMFFVLVFVLIVFSVDSNIQGRDPVIFLSSHIKLINVLLLGLYLIVWPAIFATFGLYQSQRLVIAKKEFLNIWKAVGVGTMVIASMSVIFGRQDITLALLAYFWILCSSTTFSIRMLIRIVLFRVRKHGYNLRHVVVVGNGKRGKALASRLVEKKESGYKFLGFVDDHTNDGDEDSNFACHLDEFPGFLDNHVVDEVFVTLPMKSYYSQICDIIQACEQQGVPVHIPLDFFSARIAKTKSLELDGVYFMVHYTGRELDLTEMLFKRSVDIIVSSLLLVLFFPLFIGIALMIKITSEGWVFFIQERVGYNKRRFKLLKFRTMVENAEAQQTKLEHLNEVDGAIFKMKNDPRLTQIGKILRKTSLDELPQLFNVLKGDMSLVGPRPLPIRDVNLFNAQWPKRRFSVRPGITGLWQINGRSETKFDRFIKYDLEYIDTWSPWLDLKIMLKTVPVVLNGTGAM